MRSSFYRVGLFAVTSFCPRHFLLASLRRERVADHGRVELVEPRPKICLASRGSNPVVHGEGKRTLGGHPLGGVLQPAHAEAGTPCSLPCLGGFGIKSPAQVLHRTSLMSGN